MAEVTIGAGALASLRGLAGGGGSSSGADKAARTCARGTTGKRDVEAVAMIGGIGRFDEKNDLRFFALPASAVPALTADIVETVY